MEDGRRRTPFALAAIMAVILLLASAVPAGADSAPSQPSRGVDFVSLIISYVDDSEDLDLDDLDEVGATIKYVYQIIPAVALSVPATGVDEVIEDLEGNVRIEGVESDLVVQANLDPNDPQFPNLWGLHNTGQAGGTLDADIDAPEAWDITTGNSGTVLAIVDTGVDTNHPDLAANIWVNLAEANGIPGFDDDNNGFIDDVNGWNFFDNAPWLFFSADEDSHATHVAGTIAADGNNATGVVGVNGDAQMMVLKFLGPGGSGYTSDAIAAIEYAMSNGAEVINASWGCQESPSQPNCFSQATKDAIGAFNGVFVAAAGTNGTDNDGVFSHYPSSYNSPNIIAVAATDRNDALASFSNVGTTSVDLGGPGVSILSTLPLNQYGYGSGTSMATPHVSGVAALLLALDPTLSPAEVKGLILDNADSVSSLAGITVTGGRLNAANAVGTVSPPPAVPTLVSIAVTPTDPSVVVGTTQQFMATGTYSDASTGDLTSDVTWASSLAAVATIAAGGQATSVAEGTTTISAALEAVVGSTILSVTATAPLPPPPPPGTGIIFDAASSATGSGTSLTWSHTVGVGGTNRLLVVSIATDTTPVSGVTYGGQALTLIGGQIDPDDASRVGLWYLVAPPTGTNNIVATFAEGTDAIGGSTSWTGVNQTTPLGTAVFASGEGGTAAVTVASAAGEVVVDALATIDIETRTVGSGQTERWNLDEGDLGGAGSSVSGAAAVNMSWAANGFWAIGAVPLRPSIV